MVDVSKPKTSNKILLAAVLVVIIVAAVSVTAYYCLPRETPNPEVVTYFGEGAWANFTLSIYNADGTVASSGNMLACAYSGTYGGSDCWIYVENTTYIGSDGSIVSDVVTDYLDKSSYSTLHKTEVVTSDGAEIYNEAFSPGEAGFMDTIATVRNFTVTATDKSVTVPAGTFSTTERQGSITYASDPTTYDFSSWTSSTVPAWGVVKYQFHLGGVLFSEYLLESYGS
ncbi:hypothetical protein GX563_01550 [Candidatus Bathyarchaeota archaeon]|nr:hypothetical protein [Candidatus Bathyarchaeota archaeon]